jgi:hypothetical protein
MFADRAAPNETQSLLGFPLTQISPLNAMLSFFASGKSSSNFIQTAFIINHNKPPS